MTSVLVLLSTYNGEKFLREQLDSVYNQQNVAVQILVRDDGSTDTTVEILKEYESSRGNMTILVEQNVGAARSFHRLAWYAYKDMPQKYDWYAFCDQDDVWIPEKLDVSIGSLAGNGNPYQLFYGRAWIVDANLVTKRAMTVPIVNTLEANIVASHSLGCTQVFNYALLKSFVSLKPYIDSAADGDYVILHDGWNAIVAYSLDANVVVGQAPLLKYRQHGHNVVGAGQSRFRANIERMKRCLSGKCLKSWKCKKVLDALGDQLPDKNRLVLERCAYYKKSVWSRLRLACTPSMYQYALGDNIGVFVSIICGEF